MNMALDLRMPHSMPHVSRLRRVLDDATERNCWRSWEGRNTGRRGVAVFEVGGGFEGEGVEFGGGGWGAVVGDFAG